MSVVRGFNFGVLFSEKFGSPALGGWDHGGIGRSVSIVSAGDSGQDGVNALDNFIAAGARSFQLVGRRSDHFYQRRNLYPKIDCPV